LCWWCQPKNHALGRQRAVTLALTRLTIAACPRSASAQVW
jgi:hypothetical protein